MRFLLVIFKRLFNRASPSEPAGADVPDEWVNQPVLHGGDTLPDSSLANMSQFANRTGVKHLNYLNVKAFKEGRPSPTYWKYQTGVDSRGHAIFKNPAHGLRAGIITLRSYWYTHGLRTIAQILSRWAPASDTVGSLPGAPANSPSEYSRFVAEKMGVAPNHQLNLFVNWQVDDKDQLHALIAAMAEYEIRSGFQFPRSEYDEAVNLL